MRFVTMIVHAQPNCGLPRRVLSLNKPKTINDTVTNHFRLSSCRMQVYAREFPAGFYEDHPRYNTLKCDAEQSLSMSDNTECWGMIKNAAVIAPIPEFEVALVNALDHIGFRTKLKDAAPGMPTGGPPLRRAMADRTRRTNS